MIGGNGSKQPQKGTKPHASSPSCRRFDTPMSQCAITPVSNPENSELP
jgi:hypothetical protein